MGDGDSPTLLMVFEAGPIDLYGGVGAQLGEGDGSNVLVPSACTFKTALAVG